MQSKCHTGKTCVYDTVRDKNWTSNARSNHGIGFVLKEVVEAYDAPPKCVQDTACQDCPDWKFFFDKGGEGESESERIWVDY